SSSVPPFHLCCRCLVSISQHPPPPPLRPLSLHDALPIFPPGHRPATDQPPTPEPCERPRSRIPDPRSRSGADRSGVDRSGQDGRSEEHTSELQSRFDLVCRLLLEKKKSETCQCSVLYYDS